MMNYRDALERRWEHLELCLNDLEFRADDYEMCRRDPSYFISHWGWTLDPRLAEDGQPSHIPMELFPFQVEFMVWLKGCLDDKAHGTVEKSRDMGFTWLCVGFAVWMWLFRPGVVVKFGSRKQDLVDKLKDPDSIFEKIRYMIRFLPAWMVPDGFNPRIHDNHLIISNPENGSSISGEGGDNMGRGGRATIYFADEFAYVERAQTVDSALSQNSNVIIYGSTANGISSLFYKKVLNDAYRHFRLHWRSDPRKDDEWYKMMCALYDPVTVAQEIDIDHASSVEGVAIPPKFVRACVNAVLPNLDRVGSRMVAGLDVAKGGKDLSVLCSRVGPVVKELHSSSANDTTKVAQWASQLAIDLGIQHLFYDVIGVGAGVEGELNRERRPFKHSPVNVGLPASVNVYPDERTGAERFANLKAELWMHLRTLCENTWRYVEDGVGDDPNTMISLPDHPQLLAELSLPLAEADERGRVKIESKKSMAKRLDSYKSPDFAEALILSFAGEFIETMILIGRA